MLPARAINNGGHAMALPIADHWFETKRLDDGITLIWEPNAIPLVRCNMWHVRGSEFDMLLDTGFGLSSLKEHVALVTEKPVLCVGSHTHFDHIGGHWEFDERLIHSAEAALLANPTRANTVIDQYMSLDIFTALPFEGFDPERYNVRAAPPTRLIEEGDVIDLGDRRFEVLHTPGHSPGSICLWEPTSEILFSGDLVYDGEILNEVYHTVPEDVFASMERLRAIPARAIHGGHFPSFGRGRMIELIDEYLAGQRKPGCPNEVVH